MARYSVWHSTGKHDGESGHPTLAEAKAEFDHQIDRRGVVQVELTEETEDGPVVIQSWDAIDTGNSGERDPNTL